MGVKGSRERGGETSGTFSFPFTSTSSTTTIGTTCSFGGTHPRRHRV